MYAKIDPAFQVVTSVFGPAEHKNNSHSGRCVRHTRSIHIDNIPSVYLLSMVNSVLLVHLRMTTSMYRPYSGGVASSLAIIIYVAM